MASKKSPAKSPGTLKETLSHNVRQQQKRSKFTASPPEAQRPVRERVKSAEAKRKQIGSPH